MRCRLILICAFLTTLAADEAPVADAAGIVAFTGARTKVAWIQDGKLARLDTADGALRLTAIDGEIRRPLITPSGDAVIVVDFPAFASFRVAWDGEETAKLVDGRVTCVRPGEDGREIAYWQDAKNQVLAAPLDELGKAEVVWTFPFPPRERKGNGFQTSADGRRALATVPWPHIGAVGLPRTEGRDFTVLGKGCWPQVAPDNSYRMFHLFGGQHRQIALYDAAGETARFLEMDPHPDPRRQGCETPRWSNDPRFLATVDQGYHRAQPSVYLGRFAADFSQVDAWLRISAAGHVGEPDCWLADRPAAAAATVDPARLVDPAGEGGWPGDHADLVFLWEGWARTNLIRDAEGRQRRRCLLRPRGRARPFGTAAADLRGGRLEAEGLDEALHEALRTAAGVTVELIAAPFTGKVEEPMVLLHYGPAEGRANLAIIQRKNGLSCGLLGGADGVTDCGFDSPWRRDDHRGALPDIQHLAWVLGEGKLRFYVDGKLQGTCDTGGCTPASWRPGSLTLGSAHGGLMDWQGRVEGLAITARALSAKEVGGRHDLVVRRLTDRWPPRSQRMTGTLVETTAIPSLDDIKPYPRSLVMYAYEVKRRDGPRRIHVAHWAWLDDQRVLEDRQLGEAYELQLSRLDNHRHGQGERLDDDLEQVPGVEVFLDVGP